ncbi:26S proteasome complex ubiquitin receptor subunit Rpn13 [Penicillium longicatenatum]|uniref:26S proteasome complex ubiquitin receptor subunit Rpn13 n=1 Tax=Penicillium longicatenatum TaxID=1561947 RepID=UPI002549213F|nr:26S proteasome complex ubiquitin receptor subunit Rpn13 [Penicillium longicatenatum]KAJ5658624.1 26S proteasome complex ubiquitin receptor subunit Rpn13 [Penicillium longicatenatum]
MSMAPIITFKAGICDLDSSTTPATVKPKPTPGYIYLYSEDDLVHFCWRPRSSPIDEPEVDLVMIPSDGSFTPYRKDVTNGRVFVLKFSSSSQRYLFWMQSQSQHEGGDASWFSPRDLKLGEIVDTLLQGEEVDVEQEIANLPQRPSGGDDDETMEDVEGTDNDAAHHGAGSGGAGADATGGDIREEGQESREGGADGGRAANDSDPSLVVQDFLRSLGGQRQSQSQDPERPSTTLQDLLPPPTTLPFIETADESTADHLLSFLPPALLLLAQGNAEASEADTDPELAQAALLSLDLTQKKDILRKVLRSPPVYAELS